MGIEFRGDEAGERLLPNAYLCNDNPTNGDIMWAIFPKVEIYTDVMNEIVDVEICEDVLLIGGTHHISEVVIH